MARRRQASFGPDRVVEACAHWAEQHSCRVCTVGGRKGKVIAALCDRRMERCRCENCTVRRPQAPLQLQLPLPLPLPLLLKWQLQLQ